MANDGHRTRPIGGPEGPGSADPFRRTARLAEALEAYGDELREGRSPDREAFLARYPDLVEELRDALPALDFIEGAAGGPPRRLGDFRILREIGRGGMGVVYEAEQVSLGRRVALKVLLHGPAADDEALRRFEREALVLALLHHTNIVPIIAIGSERGVRYFAMTFIEGKDLRATIREAARSGTPIDLRIAARWGLEIAGALDHAHRRGVIHRDVKPSNILIDERGQSWLGDFGLARRADDTVTLARMGTLSYMSPEQTGALVHPIDHRTDIYSLGATLYEMVAGRPVFEGDSEAQVLVKIRGEDPVSPRNHREDLDKDLEAIILRCLEKEPERRFSSARALADNLLAYLEDRPLSIRRYGLAGRAVRWARKRREAFSIGSRSILWAGLIVTAAYLYHRYTLYRQFGIELPVEIRFSSQDPSLNVQIEERDPGGGLEAIWTTWENKVTVKRGPLLCRVRAPDYLEEKVLVDADSRTIDPGSLSLYQQVLWEAKGITDHFPAVDLGEGLRIIGRTGTGVVCLEAASGKLLWSTSLGPDDELDFSSAPVMGDVDGDKVLDIVGKGFALSGRDGRIIRGIKEPAVTPAAPQARDPPEMADVNGDGFTDEVATIFDLENKTCRLEATSGRKVLWTRSIEEEVLGPARAVRPTPAAEPLLICPARSGILAFEIGSGKRLPERDLPIPSIAHLETGDLNGDGRAEVIFLTREPDMTAEEGQATLLAFTLDDREMILRKRLYRLAPESVLQWIPGAPRTRDIPFHVGDIDGDGTLEVLAPFKEPTRKGILRIDASGKDLKLFGGSSTGSEAPSPLQTLSMVPDLDGDGMPDIEFRYDSSTSSEEIFFSSKKGGERLKTPRASARRSRAARPPEVPIEETIITSLGGKRMSPQKVDLDGDGFEERLFRTRNGLRALRGGPRTLWQRFEEAIPAGDADGDGVRDLLLWEDYVYRPRMADAASGAIIATRDMYLPRDAFHQILPRDIGDLNGDGAEDVLFLRENISSTGRSPRMGHAITLLSGRDKRPIWSRETRMGPEGDPQRFGKAGEEYKGLGYESGSTATLRIRDLEGDGSRDGICRILDRFRFSYHKPGTPDNRVASQRDLFQLVVMRFNGKDGKERWYHRIWSILSPAKHDQFLALPDPLQKVVDVDAAPAFASANDDAVLDVLLLAPEPGKGEGSVAWTFRALDGISGEELWQTPFDPGAAVRAAPPFDLDGDGGEEILALTVVPPGVPGAGRLSVIALSAKSRGILWSREFQAAPGTEELIGLWPLAAADGSRHACVAYGDGAGSHLVFLDPGGNPRVTVDSRDPIRLVPAKQGVSPPSDLLLYQQGGRLRARREPGKEAWSVEFPGKSARLDAVLPAGPGGGDVFVIHDGQDLRGYEAGNLLWKSVGAEEPEILNVRGDTRPLIACRGLGGGTAVKEVKVLVDLKAIAVPPPVLSVEAESEVHPFDRGKGGEILFVISFSLFLFPLIFWILPLSILRWFWSKKDPWKKIGTVLMWLAIAILPPILQIRNIENWSSIWYWLLWSYVGTYLAIPVAILVSLPHYLYVLSMAKSLLLGPWRSFVRLALITLLVLPAPFAGSYLVLLLAGEEGLGFPEWCTLTVRSPIAILILLSLAGYLVGLGIAIPRARDRIRAWRSNRQARRHAEVQT